MATETDDDAQSTGSAHSSYLGDFTPDAGLKVGVEILGIDDLEQKLICEIKAQIHVEAEELKDTSISSRAELRALEDDELELAQSLCPSISLPKDTVNSETSQDAIFLLDAYAGVLLAVVKWHSVISLDMDLRKFPFDRHVLSVELLSTTHRFVDFTQ